MSVMVFVAVALADADEALAEALALLADALADEAEPDPLEQPARPATTAAAAVPDPIFTN